MLLFDRQSDKSVIIEKGEGSIVVKLLDADERQLKIAINGASNE